MTVWTSFGGDALVVSNLFTFANGAAAASQSRNAEVVAYSEATRLLFTTGGTESAGAVTTSGLDILDATDGTQSGYGSVDLRTIDGAVVGAVNSVAVFDQADGTVTVAVAVAAADKTQPGKVVFYELDPAAGTLTQSRVVTVGANPDQITFTPDGTRLLVANEGEPNGYGQPTSFDPEGSVSIVTLATGAVATAGFAAFNGQAAALRAEGVRLFGPNATVAQDLEPEYIAINDAGTKAYVTLQENNAIGILDIATGAWDDIVALGLKDHSLPGNGIDPSDRDGAGGTALFTPGTIRNVPVVGMYMPDGIDAFDFQGQTWLITANEGDARDYPGFGEEVRVGAGTYTLDPTTFPDAATLKTPANLGRLTVTNATGNTDGDADFDQIQVFGSRSITIWNDQGEIAWDSGDAIERDLAQFAPGLVDDARSDNKGPEPESVTVGTIDGQLFAFVGLERSSAATTAGVTTGSNMIMVFRLDDTGTGRLQGEALGVISTPGDNAPEVLDFVEEGPNGNPTLFIANEVSGTTTAVELQMPETFTLQILHASDFEGNTNAIEDAPRLAALFDHFDDFYVGNTLKLSSGDNWIPSPWYNAQVAANAAVLAPALQGVYETLFALAPGSLSGLEVFPGSFDQAILNIIGIDVSAIGNHEFDQGPAAIARIIEFRAAAGADGIFQLNEIQNIGALYPTVSANLNFAANVDVGTTQGLADAFTAALRAAETFVTTRGELVNADGTANSAGIAGELATASGDKLARFTTIEVGGETIGVIGATTQRLASISSPGNVNVEGNPGTDNLALLASQLQDEINELLGLGINKIILQSHLQDYTLESRLAELLDGVDIILSGGSDAVFANPGDVIKPGVTVSEPYPLVLNTADGETVLQVNVDGQYNYLGRLVVQFNAAGEVLIGTLNTTDRTAENYSGAFATTDEVVEGLFGDADPYAEGTLGGEVQTLADAIDTVVGAKIDNVEGYTNVFLNGLRSGVRFEETNLGNLTADANLSHAREFLATSPSGVPNAPLVSLKNSGGIRAEIGQPFGNVGPEAPVNGEVNQLGIETALAFNNALVVVQSTAAGLLALLEHGVANDSPAGPGQFPQVGGLQFSYDRSRPANDRIQSLVVVDDDGAVIDVIVRDGELVGDATRAINIVTLNFLAATNPVTGLGGDNYPFGIARTPGTTDVNLFEGTLPVSVPYDLEGSEQDAFADYLNENFGTPETAYNQADTPISGDTRIQNLGFREDSLDDVTEVLSVIFGDASGNVGETVGTQDGTLDTNFFRVEDGASITRFDFAGSPSVGDGEAEIGLVSWTDTSALLSYSGAPGAVRTAAVNAFTGTSLTIDGFEEVTIALGGEDDRTLVVLGALSGTAVTGGGNDTILFTSDAALPGTVIVDSGEGDDTIETGEGDDIILAGIGNDTITTNGGADTIDAGEGDDVIDSGNGADTIKAGLGNDVVIGGLQPDTLDFADTANGVRVNLAISSAQDTGEGVDTITGVDNLVGSAFADTLDGNSGTNGIEGGAGNDTIQGRQGNDTLNGGDGNDLIRPGTGHDVADGGAGIDTVSYFDLIASVTVDLAITSSQNTGAGGTDRLANFENLTGGAANDTLRGNGQGNRIQGASGNDLIEGRAGNDDLRGEAGNDTIRGGTGNDLIDGGHGTDLASYFDFTSAVRVDLQVTGSQNTGAAGFDTIRNVENLSGGAGGDTLRGDAFANTIFGNGGNDTIQGRGGIDQLYGSAGADRFVYTSVTDAKPGVNLETIFDFTSADRLVLTEIDAKTTVAGNQAFSFIGSASFGGVAGQLRYSLGVVSADVNGDMVADFAVKLSGSPSLNSFLFDL